MSSTIDGPDKVRVAIAVHVEGAGPVVEVQPVQRVLKKRAEALHAVLGIALHPCNLSAGNGDGARSDQPVLHAVIVDIDARIAIWPVDLVCTVEVHLGRPCPKLAGSCAFVSGYDVYSASPVKGRPVLNASRISA